MKIIVVDDEPLVKQYIVQCVRDAGGENEITAAVTSGVKGAAGAFRAGGKIRRGRQVPMLGPAALFFLPSISMFPKM